MQPLIRDPTPDDVLNAVIGSKFKKPVGLPPGTKFLGTVDWSDTRQYPSIGQIADIYLGGAGFFLGYEHQDEARFYSWMTYLHERHTWHHAFVREFEKLLKEKGISIERTTPGIGWTRG